MPVLQNADDLGVHRSTVYHELKRNGDGIGRYDADVAHRRTCLRRWRASRIPRKTPPDFIDTFVYHPLVNGHAPNIIANTMAPSGHALSTR